MWDYLLDEIECAFAVLHVEGGHLIEIAAAMRLWVRLEGGCDDLGSDRRAVWREDELDGLKFGADCSLGIGNEARRRESYEQVSDGDRAQAAVGLVE